MITYPVTGLTAASGNLKTVTNVVDDLPASLRAVEEQRGTAPVPVDGVATTVGAVGSLRGKSLAGLAPSDLPGRLAYRAQRLLEASERVIGLGSVRPRRRSCKWAFSWFKSSLCRGFINAKIIFPRTVHVLRGWFAHLAPAIHYAV